MESSLRSVICGVFDGDADLEGGYAWLTDDDGQRHEIWYPAGWELRFDPGPMLIAPDGGTFANQGDLLCVEGMPIYDDAVMRIIGPIFEAAAVTRP
jgi:hypothetical protein